MKTSILLLKFDEISSIFDKSYRMSQILQNIYSKKIFDFQSMTNIPQGMRDELIREYTILKIKPISHIKSPDGTIKYLFELEDNNCIESVSLKDINDRYTFCISTQCGCRMNCTFCKTGKMGLIRNLTQVEILSQILFLSSFINKYFNIVFMGMGEPLDNFDNLIECISMLTTNKHFEFSPSRITVSTCGLTDKIIPLFEKHPGIRLAVSLNSAIQAKREKIMPISKKYKISDLFKTLEFCYKKFKTRITLEFVLIDNFNMDNEELKALLNLNKDIFHLNLIPINSGNEKIKSPNNNTIQIFYNKLKDAGFNVTRRYRRGELIQADCGQLYWEKKGSINNNI